MKLSTKQKIKISTFAVDSARKLQHGKHIDPIITEWLENVKDRFDCKVRESFCILPYDQSSTKQMVLCNYVATQTVVVKWLIVCLVVTEMTKVILYI